MDTNQRTVVDQITIQILDDHSINIHTSKIFQSKPTQQEILYEGIVVILIGLQQTLNGLKNIAKERNTDIDKK